jgi:hypothetical protein
MFLKYPIICSHVYCYSNNSLHPPSSKQWTCVMALLVPWWYHDQSWRLRVSFYAGRFAHQILVEMWIPPCGIDISIRIWWVKRPTWKPTLRNRETWSLISITHQKKLLKSVPTWSKLWHLIESRHVLIGIGHLYCSQPLKFGWLVPLVSSWEHFQPIVT